MTKAHELLAIKNALASETTMFPLSKFLIVLSSRLYQNLKPDEETFELYGCNVVECEYLNSNEFLIARRFNTGEWV